MDKQQLVKILRVEGFPEKILEAFTLVNREDFIPEKLKEYAYEDHPLPIGHGQTISQPSTIAFMLDQLELKNGIRILEIGSGCGYVLALIDNVVEGSKIYGVEIVKELAELSKKNIGRNEDTGIRKNTIDIKNSNGYGGLKDEMPFDRILVSAAADEMPKKILNQLADGGIAVIPVNNSIYKIRRQGNDFLKTEYPGFVFVPLIK